MSNNVKAARERLALRAGVLASHNPTDQDARDIRTILADNARLTALEQPPADAELREAVEYLSNFRPCLLTTVGPEFTARIDTLLRAVRAQKPGLTEEQVEVMKMLYGAADMHGAFRDDPGQALAAEARAAFGVFADGVGE